MEEENYPVAVQLCLECQQAASTFREYSCVSELSSKLQDTQQQIELELEAALAKNCLHFDTHHYEKVQTAYRHLGKTQVQKMNPNTDMVIMKMPCLDCHGSIAVPFYHSCS
jgi:ribosomal protein L44E